LLFVVNDKKQKMLIGSNIRHVCSNQRISGSNLVVVGNNNLILGYDNEVYGNDNTIQGDRVKVWGDKNKIIGNFAKVFTGDYNSIDTNNQTGEFVYPSGRNNTFVVRPPPIRPLAARPPPPAAAAPPPRRLVLTIKKEKKRARDDDDGEVLFVEGPLPTDVLHDKPIPDGNADQKACIVCLERVPCCVALPCMHLSYCIACARRLCFGQTGVELYERGKVKCAECRVAVDAIKRTF
jgi:hypothetical protein